LLQICEDKAGGGGEEQVERDMTWSMIVSARDVRVLDEVVTANQLEKGSTDQSTINTGPKHTTDPHHSWHQ
jgi:hypothetical protein